MSKRFAVLGSPIAHSKSPVIQLAAYEFLNLDYSYERFDVNQAGFAEFLYSTGINFDGFSLTMPLKDSAIACASIVDEMSTIAGASNTLLRTATGWSAFNTDVFGIQQALSHAGISNVKKSLVIGTGATARSALIAISKSFPGSKVLLWGRTLSNVAQLAKFACSLGLKVKRTRNLGRAVTRVQLVVSTLPPHALDSQITSLASKKAKTSAALFDVAYEPWPSAAARLWHQHNLPVVSGLEMLLWQAVAQVRIFHHGDANVAFENETALVDRMRAALT